MTYDWRIEAARLFREFGPIEAVRRARVELQAARQSKEAAAIDAAKNTLHEVRRYQRRHAAGKWTVILGLLAIITAAVILVLQCVGWLRVGWWPELPLAEGLEALGFSGREIIAEIHWGGIRKIAAWLLFDVSLTAGLFVSGIFLTWAGSRLLDAAPRPPAKE